MKLRRRQFLHLAAGTVAFSAVSCIASAQTYPARPITMVVGFGAGGPSDIIARILAEGMRGSLGQSERVPFGDDVCFSPISELLRCRLWRF
jgi:tripartite-type tricarboxylate transporter receptor subunit TctC